MENLQNRRCILLGHRIGYSLSPIIHQAAYRELGLDWQYTVLDVLESDLNAVLEEIDGEQTVGANVTIPHKQAVFKQVDIRTKTAQAVGAVNTVYRENGKLVGENTDVAGFLGPLHSLSDRHWPAMTALILGAGGAARAVAYALTTVLGLKSVTIAARREATARALPGVSVVSWADRSKAGACADLIVNTTPVGMAPQQDASPFPENQHFSDEQVVYDLIYTPERTRLMQNAENAGACVVGGLPMLIGQAAESFRIWSGQDMPIEAVKKALRNHRAGSDNS